MHTTTLHSSAAQAVPAVSVRLPRADTVGGAAVMPVRRITSDAVFAGETLVVIQHGESEYRLRQTSLGKLILTK